MTTSPIAGFDHILVHGLSDGRSLTSALADRSSSCVCKCVWDTCLTPDPTSAPTINPSPFPTSGSHSCHYPGSDYSSYVEPSAETSDKPTATPSTVSSSAPTSTPSLVPSSASSQLQTVALHCHQQQLHL